MAISIWNVISSVLLPMGLALCFLMLCGIRPLERLSQRACGVKLHLGEVKIRAPVVVFIICAIMFISEWRHLVAQKSLRPMKTDLGDSLWRADLARHQRNWWLSLSTCITWAVLLRLAPIISSLRKTLDELKERKAAVLAAQGTSESHSGQKSKAA
eukprot:Selendium_serpulae@DN3716_c0_g1_i1.p1